MRRSAKIPGSALLSRAQLSAALSAFPEAGALVRVLAGGSGGFAPAARVRARGGVLWVRRAPLAARPPERLRAQSALGALLAARGLPVPRPLLTPAGDAFAVLGDGIWTATPEAPGRDLYRDGEAGDEAVPEAVGLSLGATLARLHLAAAAFAAPLDPAPAGPTAGLRTVESPTLEEGIRALGPGALARGARLASRPGAARALDLARGAREALRPRLPLPSGPLHGDWHRANALYGPGGEVTAVLDLDACFRGPWLFDLARLADDLAFTWWRVLRGAPPRPDRGALALAGYASVRPLSRAEEEALPAMLAAFRIDARIAAALAEDEALPEGAPSAVLDRLGAELEWLASGPGRDAARAISGGVP
ncbi:phosphotransferase [Myxococcota bacterium]|nr:phosphotransferase [Myxococcota bacterium]